MYIKNKMAEEKVETAKKSAFDILNENISKLIKILQRINEIIKTYENPFGWDSTELKEKRSDPDLKVKREQLIKEFKSLTDLGIKDPGSYIRIMNRFPAGWKNTASYLIFCINKSPEWIWSKYDINTGKRYSDRRDQILKVYDQFVNNFNEIKLKLSKEYIDNKKYLERERKRQEKAAVRKLERRFRNDTSFKLSYMLIYDPLILLENKLLHEKMSNLRNDLSDKKLRSTLCKYKDEVIDRDPDKVYVESLFTEKEIAVMKYRLSKYLSADPKNRIQWKKLKRRLMNLARFTYDDDEREFYDKETNRKTSTIVYHTAYVKNDKLRNREFSKIQSELSEDDVDDIISMLSLDQKKYYEELIKRLD